MVRLDDILLTLLVRMRCASSCVRWSSSDTEGSIFGYIRSGVPLLVKIISIGNIQYSVIGDTQHGAEDSNVSDVHATLKAHLTCLCQV